MTPDAIADPESTPNPLEYGMIDGYHITYEHGPTSWGAWSDDLPGVFAVDTSRETIEERMRGAIAFALEDDDQEEKRKGA